jgi:anti-sigma-K factor RskA
MFWTARNNDRQELAVLEQKLDTMGRRQQGLAASLDRYRQEADMASEPGTQPVAMRSMLPGHPMAATIYWNKARNEAYVSVQKLPPAPDGMQYQLWAIADGKPVSIGMLDNDIVVSGGMQKVPQAVTGGQAFAVSLEKEGGNATPTPDKIFLMGKTPA